MPNGLNARATFQTPASTGNTTGLLASIEHGLNNAGATGSALNQLLGTFSYDYNQKANITAINESGSVARQRNYTLDPIERLTNVADGSGTSLENYTLDEEGNRIASHLASFHVTNPANRVTEDEAFQFEYDVNGNLVRKTTKATGETWVYEYSAYDELIRATRQSGLDAATAQESIAYVFDAMGRRHFREVRDVSGATTGSTIWHYDNEEIVYQVNIDEAGNEESRRYSYSDTVDDILALTRSNSDGTPLQDSLYYHKDHQNSVRAITDVVGQVINEYSYDAYGIEETVVEGVLQQFKYTGREYDQETGLYHYRARAYDPSIGRFLQEDPIWFAAADFNVYRYVGNNPVNMVDPTGLTAITYGAQSSIMTGVLTAGNIATRLMLSSGARTAQYLRTANKAKLSAIAGSLACTFFILADTLEAKSLNPNAVITVDPSKCGVTAMSPAEPLPRSIPLPPVPKKGCTCTARADANENIVGNTGGFAFGTAHAASCGPAAKKAKRIATHKLGRQPKHVGVRCSSK